MGIIVKNVFSLIRLKRKSASKYADKTVFIFTHRNSHMYGSYVIYRLFNSCFNSIHFHCSCLTENGYSFCVY